MKRAFALLIALLCLAAAALAEDNEYLGCKHARTHENEVFTCVVPACDPVDDDFFKDDLLIGDSITASLDSRDVLPGLHIEYVIGLSPNAALKYHNVSYKGKDYTMAGLAAELQPRRLFVMLGSNGLDKMKSGVILDDYHLLLDELLDTLPNTEIYLLSVTPIRSPATKEKYPTFTHKRIVAFNKGLLQMAEAHGVHYIDNYTPLMQANMADGLKENFTGDGIHLTKQGAEKVAENIRTHVVTMKVYIEEEML